MSQCRADRNGYVILFGLDRPLSNFFVTVLNEHDEPLIESEGRANVLGILGLILSDESKSFFKNEIDRIAMDLDPIENGGLKYEPLLGDLDEAELW